MRQIGRRDELKWLGLPVAMLVAACAGSASPTVEPATAPLPTATPIATPRGTPKTVSVLPGEPWIVYEWGVPEADGVGNMIIRPDGTDEHWATPDAPIGGTAGQGGDGWQLHPDWSPDGDQLVFVVDANTPEIEGEKRDIWISDADGSNTRQLYDCEFPCDGAEFPAWSPDGESILFVRWEHANRITDGSTLELVNVETGEVTTVAETEGADYFGYPRWSPDGTQIVTQIDTWTSITEDSELESTSIAIVDLKVSPAKITRITDPAVWANYPDWHPTEDLIVYARRPAGALGLDQSDLYTMQPDGSQPRLLVSHDLDPEEFLNATQPSWMPDGSGVTFVRVPGDDYSQASIWAVDADGSNVRSFPTDPHGGSHPRLRPTL